MENQKAEEAQVKAKPKTDYEEWIAKQPHMKGSEEEESGWWSKVTDFISSNKELIVGIAGVLGGVAALTPALLSQLSKSKDSIKSTPSTPSEEDQKRIEQNPKSVSMKMYSFIRDSEAFTPFVKQSQYTVNIGFGHIVENRDNYSTLYPYRDDDKLVEEYMNRVANGTINDWIKGVVPAVMPVRETYDLFNNDIKNIEGIINNELTDVILEQYEFDALASFLWTMRGEGKIYSEFQPESIIKELHTLLYYNSRQDVADYMQEVDKRLVQGANVWNRREIETTLFLTGIYESLNKITLMTTDYDEVFPDMKNQYLSKKTNDNTLQNYSSYIGNDSLDESKSACEVKNIKRKIESPNLSPLVSPNELLGKDIVNGMVYPILRRIPTERGGKDNTGINNDNTICYGWFGSDRGSGQTLHYGVDLVADYNNPVIMPFSGVIEKIGWATDTSNELKRVVIRPDLNENIVISLYYLNDLFIEENKHYDAGVLIGYMGDCSPLFEGYGENTYTFMHFQINELTEDGTPINPTSCILNSMIASEPNEITWLREHPILYDFVAGDKSVNIIHPGLYEIILAGSGGTDLGYDLDWCTVQPVTEENITPYKYSVPGARGAYVRAQRQLEARSYSYTVGTNVNSVSTSFDNNLICESGNKAFGTNDSLIGNPSTKVSASKEYNIVESSEGGGVDAISNIGAFNIETGEPIPYTIIQGLGNIYNNEASDFAINTWYSEGENCKFTDGLYYSAKKTFQSGSAFDISDWNNSYDGFGNGGHVGLNGNGHLSPTPALVYIRYINWS